MQIFFKSSDGKVISHRGWVSRTKLRDDQAFSYLEMKYSLKSLFSKNVRISKFFNELPEGTILELDSASVEGRDTIVRVIPLVFSNSDEDFTVQLSNNRISDFILSKKGEYKGDDQDLSSDLYQDLVETGLFETSDQEDLPFTRGLL